MIYLCNTFSPQMMPRLEVDENRTVQFTRISAREAGEILRRGHVVSCFGHKWAAWHLSRYLHVRIPVSREELRLSPEDELIIASVVNKRRWMDHVETVPRWVFYRAKMCGC